LPEAFVKTANSK